MVKLNPLSSYDAEDCYRAIRRLATIKRWTTKHPNDEESESAWATNELNCRKKFFRNVETLNAAKQNVGEALAMAELSLMATSAYNEHSSPQRSRKNKKRGHFKFYKDQRSERESKEDGGYFSRHSRGRTLERDACRDRVNRARSFQVRRSTSNEDDGRGSNTRTSEGQGKYIRRSSSERVRQHIHVLRRSSSTGNSPSPVEKRKEQSKDKKSTSVSDGWSRYPLEETVITDPETGMKYKKGKLLGKGGFAKCYEFSDVKTKEKFAVKVVSKSRMSNPRTREKILREVEIHRHLENPNVVTFYGFFECKGAAFLILEQCVQRSMVHVLAKRKTLTEPEVRYYMLQLISGCRYIHSCKIIHRDLKLGNMLLDAQMKIKIADFGLATKVFFEGEKKTSLCGTPNYIAPEVLQKKGHSYEADIWALGCCMYTMLCGQPPFETTSLKETYHRIINSKFTTPGHVSQPASQLISKMLNVEPTERPNLSKISSDKFFLSGYTPSTLSTFCCHTAPRFPLTGLNDRNKSSLKNISKNSKLDSEKNNHQTENKQTNLKGERLPGSNENQQIRRNKRNPTTMIFGEKFPANINRQSTIVTGDSNMRSYEKTFRVYDQSGTLRLSDIKNAVRSLKNRNPLDKMEDVDSVKMVDADNCNLSFNTQSQQNDTKAGEALEASFEPLFQLMRDTVKQHRAEEGSNSSSSSSSYPDQAPFNHSPLWITKWVDYSNKYGFGYQLSDGRIGILFSDSGHILLSQDCKSVSYTSRLNKARTFTVENIPSKLQRKLVVVQNLAEYMNQHLVKGGDLGINGSKDNDDGPKQNPLSTVLMQKWYRDQNVILMQLNNGTLQVNCFKDHSKLVLSHSLNNTGSDYLLTYVRRGRQAVTWPLQTNGVQCTKYIEPEVIERIRLALNLIDQAEHVTLDRNRRIVNSPDGVSETSRLKHELSTDSAIEDLQDDVTKYEKDSHT